VAGALAVPLPAGRRALGPLQDVELQLGAHDRPQAERGELLDELAQHVAGALLRRAAVGVEHVGDAVRHAGLPRHRLEGGQVGEGDDVGQARGEAAVEVHDATQGRGGVDRAAEGHPAADRPVEVLDQHIATAVHADEIGVADPHDVDAVLGQPVACRRQAAGVEVAHDASFHIVWAQTIDL